MQHSASPLSISLFHLPLSNEAYMQMQYQQLENMVLHINIQQHTDRCLGSSIFSSSKAYICWCYRTGSVLSIYSIVEIWPFKIISPGPAGEPTMISSKSFVSLKNQIRLPFFTEIVITMCWSIRTNPEWHHLQECAGVSSTLQILLQRRVCSGYATSKRII